MVMNIKKYTKAECLSYLRDLKEKRPDYKYSMRNKEELEEIGQKLDRCVISIKRYMQSLDMYVDEQTEYYKDLNARIDNYLLHIWSKKDIFNRDSLADLGVKFGVDYKHIAYRVKKLGLDSYKLDSKQIYENKRTKKYEDRLEIYKEYYSEYKRTNKKISYEEIAYNIHCRLRKVISEIRVAGLTAMICKIVPKMSVSERVAYYTSNREELKSGKNTLFHCITVGLDYRDLQVELYNNGIIKTLPTSIYNYNISLVSDIDDFFDYKENSKKYYSTAISDEYTFNF